MLKAVVTGLWFAVLLWGLESDNRATVLLCAFTGLFAVVNLWASRFPREKTEPHGARTAAEMRALRVGYSTVAKYDKAMAAKAKARRTHPTTS